MRLHEMFLPKRFWVTSGAGMDNSKLNAFDLALMDAKISECNLVRVSSILPRDAKEIEPIKITPGAITYCVMSRMDGKSGETIGAGVGWGWLGKNEDRFGIVYEYYGPHSNEYIRKKLEKGLQRMANVRDLELSGMKFCTRSVKVEDIFGSVVAVLVYLP